MSCLVHGDVSIQSCSELEGFECCACCNIEVCTERMVKFDKLGAELSRHVHMETCDNIRNGVPNALERSSQELLMIKKIKEKNLNIGELKKYPEIIRVLSKSGDDTIEQK